MPASVFRKCSPLGVRVRNPPSRHQTWVWASITKRRLHGGSRSAIFSRAAAWKKSAAAARIDSVNGGNTAQAAAPASTSRRVIRVPDLERSTRELRVPVIFVDLGMAVPLWTRSALLPKRRSLAFTPD